MQIDWFEFIPSFARLRLAVDWLLVIIALFIVPQNRKPSAGMAWLLVIFLFPWLGYLLFFIFGSSKLPDARRHAQDTLNEAIRRVSGQLGSGNRTAESASVAVPEYFESIARLNEALTGLPVVDGNGLEILSHYDESIRRLAEDIDQAQHFVHLEYYILVMDETSEPVFAALGRAAQRGITVRVMYDWLSTRTYKNYRTMLKRLKSQGVIVQAMLPFRLPGFGYVRPDLRNHRKLVVIDDHTGYIGSQNLVKRNYHRRDEIAYDELVVRLQGPVVLELSAVFVTDWYSETSVMLDPGGPGLAPPVPSYGNVRAQLLPSGPGYEDENNLKLFTSLVHAARREITIVNPYFVPDETLIMALTTAARRGVKVTVINSEAQDQWLVAHAQCSFYEGLLKAGVDIFLYPAPVLLHSKFLTVDDEMVTVGSSNLDLRSFYLNLEVTLVVYDEAVVKAFRQVEAQYLERCTQLRLEQWMTRPWRLVLLDNLARLTSELL